LHPRPVDVLPRDDHGGARAAHARALIGSTSVYCA
jgi:hypothetical protein